MVKLYLAAVTVLLAATTSTAFVIPHHQLFNKNTPSSSCALLRLSFSSRSNDPGSNRNKRSRFEGNTREPTAQELAVMDEMIDKLADARPYDLPNAVRRAFRVISSPRFFLRIATRVDQAAAEGNTTQQEKLAALANNLVATLDAVVSTTTDQLDERAQQVQQVVQAAAEPDSGEFLVPLLPQRVDAMRAQLQSLEESSLDDGFLSTVDAWMNKSHQDGMDGMVGILQKTLQLYAGIQIGRARKRHAQAGSGSSTTEAAAATDLLEQLLQMDADLWGGALQEAAPSADTLQKLLAEVQRTSETVVLSLDAGSMAQRVQAEYLQELMKRIQVVLAQQKKQ